MPYKVLQLIKQYKGNAPLLNGMAKTTSGEFATIACYLAGKDDGHNGMADVAAETVYLQLPKKQLHWYKLASARAVADLIDTHDIDVVVCQFRRTIPIGVVARYLSKRRPKLVGVLHGIVGGRNSVFRKLVNFFVYRKLDRLVSVSVSGVPAIVQHNWCLAADKLTAVPNGIDVDRLEQQAAAGSELVFPAADDDTVFLMVGRLAPVKNHSATIRAFARLLQQGVKAQLWIAGTGPLQARLQSLIDELQCQQHIKLLGFRKDIPALLQRADVFVMPSLREGLPLALMEAMALQVPVVTSASTGMHELVPDESLGFLVDPASEDSILLAMNRLLNTPPATLTAMADKARQRVRAEYSVQAMVARYETVYRDVLSTPSPLLNANER